MAGRQTTHPPVSLHVGARRCCGRGVCAPQTGGQAWPQVSCLPPSWRQQAWGWPLSWNACPAAFAQDLPQNLLWRRPSAHRQRSGGAGWGARSTIATGPPRAARLHWMFARLRWMFVRLRRGPDFGPWAARRGAPGGGAWVVVFAWLATACVGAASPARSAVLGLKALATSPRLKFMPLSVARVIFCTSSACMVAASAREFCSSQNCTALSSCMRLSSSCTSIVGATQLESLGNCAMLLEAPLARLCRKSKPGTNLPKSKGGVSLMAAPREMGLWWGTAYSTALRPRRRRRAPALSRSVFMPIHGAGRVRGGAAHRHTQPDPALRRFGVLKHQGDRHRAVLDQRGLQVQQHHMVAAGLELHRLAGGQVECGQGAHFHDAVFQLHRVHFGAACGGRLDAHQAAVRLGRQAHEDAGDLAARRAGAGPGAVDLDLDRCGLRKGSAADQRAHQGGRVKQFFHGYLSLFGGMPGGGGMWRREKIVGGDSLAPAAIKNTADQRPAGGPRGGSGAAVRAAICVAARARRPCAGGWGRGWSASRPGAGAPTWTHRGQSGWWPDCGTAPPSVCERSSMTPAPEQISPSACGWSIGDAPATPMDMTTPASTKRTSQRTWRRVCIGDSSMRPRL